MYSFAVIVLVLHLSYCFAYPITIHTFGDGYDTDLFDADDADAWNAVDNGRNDPLISPFAPSPFRIVDDDSPLIIHNAPRFPIGGPGPIISGTGLGNVWEKANSFPKIRGGVGPMVGVRGFQGTWSDNGMGLSAMYE